MIQDRRSTSLALVRDPAIPLAMLLGLGAVGVLLQFTEPLNHDVGWLLLGTGRMLDGAALYVDGFVDVNPPPILYVLSPPVALARLGGLSEVSVFRLYVLAVAAASLWLCGRMLRTLFGGAGRLRAAYGLAVIGFVFLVWPAAEPSGRVVHALGQREHFVVLFLFPYLLGAAVRLRGRAPAAGPAVTAGVLAALALCMKPPYLVAVLATEGILIARRRSWRSLVRPELPALVATGALTAGSVLVFSPAYLKIALPLALRTYWAYQVPLAGLVQPVDLVLLALSVGAIALARRREGLRELGAVLWAAGACFYAAYIAGGTQWLYHLLPFRSAMLLCLVLPGLALIPSGSSPPSGRPLPRALAALAVACTLLLAVWISPTNPGRTLRRATASSPPDGSIGAEPLRLAVDRHARGGTLFFLSTSVRPAFPMVNEAEAGWTSRFSCLWPLAALVRSRDASAPGAGRLSPDEADELEEYLRRAVLEDLRAHPPDLVFVDVGRAKQGLPVGFDLLAFFLRDRQFARIWSDYERAGRVGRFALFRKREALGPAGPVSGRS